ncbi:MAG: LysR substrate-binding domain-containing protein [Leucobacter sp.]
MNESDTGTGFPGTDSSGADFPGTNESAAGGSAADAPRLDALELGTGAPPPEPLRLGFARGTAPSKWAKRWSRAVPSQPLELLPLTVSGTPDPNGPRPDVLLERVAPGARPAGNGVEPPTRHAVRLYTEAVALVVPADHELAEQEAVDRDALALVTLLAHPDHAAAWPDPEPWADPAWAPRDAAAALESVATGLGAILLPLPLARHLSSKRAHAVLPVVDEAPLAGTEIWVSWAAERDAADVQQLVGIMRGRTARSERGAVAEDPAARPRVSRGEKAPRAQQAKRGEKAKLPKNSRGAQLAAARDKHAAQQRRKQRRTR